MTPTLSSYRHLASTRRTLTALAAVACPPQARELGLLDAIVDHVELSMRSLPAELRLGLLAGLTALELAALPRFGARFSKLAPCDAVSHYERWRHGNGVQRQFIKGVSGLLHLAHFEHPAIADRLGYTPERWVAKVKQRRLTVHREAIEDHQRALLVPEPLIAELEAFARDSATREAG